VLGPTLLEKLLLEVFREETLDEEIEEENDELRVKPVPDLYINN